MMTRSLRLTLAATLLGTMSIATVALADDHADDPIADDLAGVDASFPPPAAAGGDCAAMATRLGAIVGDAQDPSIVGEIAHECREGAWSQASIDCFLAAPDFDGLGRCVERLIADVEQQLAAYDAQLADLDAEMAALDADLDAQLGGADVPPAADDAADAAAPSDDADLSVDDADLSLDDPGAPVVL